VHNLFSQNKNSANLKLKLTRGIERKKNGKKKKRGWIKLQKRGVCLLKKKVSIVVESSLSKFVT
jgi:hypothetical protein